MSMSDHDPDDPEPPEELEQTRDFDDESDMIVAGNEETAKIDGHDGEVRIYVVDEDGEWVQSDTTVADIDMDTDSVQAHEHDEDKDTDME